MTYPFVPKSSSRTENLFINGVKMRNVLIGLLCLSLIPSASHAENKKPTTKSVQARSPEYPEPYDYRGIRLGMTLGEFKKAPSAAKISQLTADFRYADFSIEPVCSNDQRARDIFTLVPVRGTQDSGGTACTWAYFKQSKYLSKWTVAELSVGGYLTHSYRFDFIQKPEDEEPRLYQIEIQVSSEAYAAIVLGLEEKFSKPTMVQNGVVQNAMGASFASTTSTWNNAQSRIELTQRHAKIDQGNLLYELKEYAAFADSLVTKRLRESSNL